MKLELTVCQYEDLNTWEAKHRACLCIYDAVQKEIQRDKENALVALTKNLSYSNTKMGCLELGKKTEGQNDIVDTFFNKVYWDKPLLADEVLTKFQEWFDEYRQEQLAFYMSDPQMASAEFSLLFLENGYKIA